MSKKIAVVSLGCDKNRIDTEKMLWYLSSGDYVVTSDYSEADIIIVNTCAFIESARQEAIDTIIEMAEYKRRGSAEKLIVTGCLVEKYKDELPNGMILPIISNQKINDYLKEIATICNINKNLTFHVARHSCATSVLIANGVPIETVSKILGHTNIRTTQIYARITDVKVSKDLEMLANILNKKSQ